MTLGFSPTTAGVFSQTATFSGANTASVGLTGIAYGLQSGLTFSASAGTIIAPFATGSMSAVAFGGMTVSNYLSQASQTGLSGSGEAIYGFTITNAGNYVINALVNAPSDAANSFYINIDGQPTDPTMIWDVPVTSGFTNQLVSWRGNGADTNNQFVPIVFTNLTVGTHQLIVRGREAGAQLAAIAVTPIPSAPSPFLAWNVWQTASLTIQAQADAAGNNSFHYDFGDSSSTNVANPIHTYTAQGTYAVTITVTNSSGQKLLNSKSITVTP